jgi:amidophosphoribosyltransferase
MCTGDGTKFHLRKANGLSSDVFKDHHMRELQGHMGIAHCRYPTAGNSSSAEAQPFYTNTPYGLCLAHNGNLTNCAEVSQHMQDSLRHCNTTSDSELLLNVLANELMETAVAKEAMSPEDVFGAVRRVHKLVRGGYAGVAMVSTGGIIAFRDPYGIRPLVFGTRRSGGVTDYLIASESVAIDTAGFELVRDVEPGEAIYIDAQGRLFTEQCHDSPTLSPCIFEHVYLARPDSVIDGVSVYASRLRMGEKLAIKIRKVIGDMPIDVRQSCRRCRCTVLPCTQTKMHASNNLFIVVRACAGCHLQVVMPVPDTSRPCALEAARCLGLPYREGFIKNRYIARTFIMPGQTNRKKVGGATHSAVLHIVCAIAVLPAPGSAC